MPGQHKPEQRSGQQAPPEHAPEPVVAAEEVQSQGLAVSFIFKGLGLAATYIFVSALLIQFNKYLMHKDRFPYAVALSACHMAMTLFWSIFLFWMKPSMYSAMPQTEGRRTSLLRWFLPLGWLFAIGLIGSNKAYQYCNVAFLQFMKEANVVVVFALGSLIGLQQCTRSRFVVLVWILFGACMAIRGEVQFVWFGFVVQTISQLGECGKTVLGEWIMRESSLKLDPLTYTMFMSPVCLSILVVMTALTWEHEITVRLAQWWHLLLPNACLAFLLNVMVAMIIKECNAVSFMLIGLVKDMVIVLASVLLFGELVVREQLYGFAVCLGGILFWSYMRIEPKSPIVRAFQIALGEINHPDEKTELLARKV